MEDINDFTLRPLRLDDFIGQDELKQSLKVFIHGAKMRQESLDHILFYGPPGLGKTTLSGIIANELGVRIKVVNGASIARTGDIATILSTLNPGDVLFIDEIHRIPLAVEEILYGAMEDYKLSVAVGHDEKCKSLTIELAPFTLIGATTRQGDISSPLRDRFGISMNLKYYTIDNLIEIILRTSKVLQFPISLSGAKLIAIRSRGTPRIANKLFRRIRDFACYYHKDSIDDDTVNATFKILKIDEFGLDEIDNKYLRCLIERFNNQPTGLSSIASAIGEQERNLVEFYEPYLVQRGLINLTKRGRKCTRLAFEHIKKLEKNSREDSIKLLQEKS